MGKKGGKKRLDAKDYGTTELTFYGYFDQAHNQRPGFKGRQTSPEYSEELQKIWDRAQDPTNTGESWETSRCGRGGVKAIKK